MKKFALIISILIFSKILNAETFDPKACVSPEDETIAGMCEIAKKINVPLMKVGVSLMFSAAESSAYLCSFSLTNSYFEAKEKLLKDEDLSKAYRATLHIAKSNPPIDFKTSPNLFCKKKYELLGPSNLNKKGPNGGPSPVFYK